MRYYGNIMEYKILNIIGYKTLKFIIMTMVIVRWVYFHIHPHYNKFRMSNDEYHFIHAKTGQLFSNYKWVDEPDIEPR
jgi:hypothetical protein